MKKRITFYSIIFILLYMLDAVFVPVKISGIAPELVLVGVVCIGVLENERFGAVFGLIFGLFCDFSSSGIFGTKAILFMFIGFFAGVLTEKFISGSFFGAFFLTFVFTSFHEFITCVSYSFFMSVPLQNTLVYIALPKIIMSLPAVLALYFILKLIRGKIIKHEEKVGIW